MYTDWKIIESIDGGGQAEVFTVSRAGDETLYALKRFKNSKREERSKSEILTMKNLWALGLNVPQIIDDGEYKEGRPYFVTTYYSEGSLRKHIKSDVDSVKNYDFILSLCKAIREINTAGYAHRDLKPENILLDENLTPIICDYGLGYNLEDGQSITQLGEPIGSTHYLHKDAFNIKSIDRTLQAALDGYSFGKIMYEIVANEQLLGFTKPTDVCESITKYFGDDYKSTRFVRSVSRLLDDDLSRVGEYWQLFPEEIERIFHTEPLSYELPKIMVETIKQKVAHNLKSKSVSSNISDDELLSTTQEIESAVKKNPAIELTNRLFEEQGDSSKINISSDKNLREILEGVGVRSNYGIEPLEELGRKQSLVIKEMYIDSPINDSNIGITMLNDNPSLIVLISRIQKNSGYIDIDQKKIHKLEFNPVAEEITDLIVSINNKINQIIGE